MWYDVVFFVVVLLFFLLMFGFVNGFGYGGGDFIVVEDGFVVDVVCCVVDGLD